MKSAATFLVFVLFVTSWAGSPLSAGEDQPNSHIQLVLKHLADKKYTLPAGDYVLLARQPMGLVAETIIFELDAERVVCVPGTHARAEIDRQPLAKSQAKLVRDVVTRDAVQSLPRDSGRVGFDGSAFVAMIRLSNRTKMIGHWSPDAPAVDLLAAMLDRELQSRKPRLPQ
jgi:hypothetical protein